MVLASPQQHLRMICSVCTNGAWSFRRFVDGFVSDAVMLAPDRLLTLDCQRNYSLVQPCQLQFFISIFLLWAFAFFKPCRNLIPFPSALLTTIREQLLCLTLQSWVLEASRLAHVFNECDVWPSHVCLRFNARVNGDARLWALQGLRVASASLAG